MESDAHRFGVTNTVRFEAGGAEDMREEERASSSGNGEQGEVRSGSVRARDGSEGPDLVGKVGPGKVVCRRGLIHTGSGTSPTTRPRRQDIRM